MRGRGNAIVGWRPLSIGARFAATVPLLVLVGVVAGCGSDRVYEDAVNEAESGVAAHLEITAREVSHLLEGHASLSAVSEQDIAAAFLNDLRGYTGQSAGPSDNRAVYDIVQEADGTVVFSVFFGSTAYGAGGLVTTNQFRHSCGTISGRFAEAAIALGDADCPAAIERLAGEESLAVSMTENAAKHGVDVEALS
jgi:hypothetical protein